MKKLICAALAVLITAISVPAAGQVMQTYSFEADGTAVGIRPIKCWDDGSGRYCQLLTPDLFKSVIDDCDAVTGWTALGNDTTGIAVDLDHVLGSNSLEFDKVDGTDNTKFGGIQKTLSSVDLDDHVKDGGYIFCPINVSALTDIDYCFIRLGSSSTAYNEWRVADTDMTTGWQLLAFPIQEPSTAGNTGAGWDESDVDYVAVGCHFDAETDALADLRVDNIFILSGMQTGSEIVALLIAAVAHLATIAGDTTSLDTKITTTDADTGAGTDNVQQVVAVVPGAGGAVQPDVGAGNVGTGTPRVTLGATDPAVVDLAAIELINTDIETAVQIIDDWDETDRAKVNPIVGQAGVAAGTGAMGVTVPRVTLATDDPAVTDLAAIELINTDIETAIQIIDDWDESDRAKVNPIVGQAGVAAGTGVMGVTVPRVTLATDDPAVTDLAAIELINTDIETAVQIIDDWDETDRAKVNPIVGQAGIAAGAGATSVTVPRTITATDSPDVTALEKIDDWDESDRAKVNPIVGQAGISAGTGAMGVTVPRVTLATDDPAVTDLAAIELIVTDIETAVQIMDDWDNGDNAKVDITAQALTALKVSATAAANTAGNPIFVSAAGATSNMTATGPTATDVTPDLVLAAQDVSDCKHWGLHIWNNGGGGNPLTDADVQVSRDGGVTYFSLTWTACDNLADADECDYDYPFNSFTHMLVYTTSAVGTSVTVQFSSQK